MKVTVIDVASKAIDSEVMVRENVTILQKTSIILYPL